MAPNKGYSGGQANRHDFAFPNQPPVVACR